MTAFQLVVSFAVLLTALGASMLIHSISSKKKILNNFRLLAEQLGGMVHQENFFSYPVFQGDYRGRKVSVGFHAIKNRSTEVIYLVLTSSVNSRFSTMLIQENFFKPLQNPVQWTKEMGSMIPDLKTPYQAWAKEEDHARTRQLFHDPALPVLLEGLKEFPSLMLGPLMVLVSKPYDGNKDTTPETALRHLQTLDSMAQRMEAIR
jgi:hypothetical protein